MPLLTVIICTYNRSELLRSCMESIVEQTADPGDYQIIVVNNNSTDDTNAVAAEFIRTYPRHRIHLYTEFEQGLSHAKNRGFKEAETAWVAYLDDDAKAHPDFVESILQTIGTYNYDCFGGIYHPWFKYGRPKWYLDGWGSNVRVGITAPQVLEKGFVSGGIMIIKKELLEKYNGFPTNLGMVGNVMRYGEETQLQEQLRKNGYIIGYTPHVQMDHLVARQKTKLGFFLKSSYSLGKSHWDYMNRRPTMDNIFWLVKATLKDYFKHCFTYLRKIDFKNYHIQNYILDVYKPFLVGLGKIVGGLKHIIHSKQKST